MGMRIGIALALSASLACGSAAPPAAAPATAAATTAVTAAPAPTGPLTVIQGNNIDTLDPHTNTRAEGFSVLVNIEEGLIGRDPQTMRPAPSLATSWSQPDTNMWVFKLRTGVTFHN